MKIFILQIIKICSTKESTDTYIPMYAINRNWNNTLYYTVLNPGKFLQSILWDKIENIAITSDFVIIVSPRKEQLYTCCT